MRGGGICWELEPVTLEKGVSTCHLRARAQSVRFIRVCVHTRSVRDVQRLPSCSEALAPPVYHGTTHAAVRAVQVQGKMCVIDADVEAVQVREHNMHTDHIRAAGIDEGLGASHIRGGGIYLPPPKAPEF
eukprot:8164293-Pyramimonas_sp.AAC.1